MVGTKLTFLSNRWIDLNDLSTISNLTIEDIALGLSRTNRFYGQTIKPYSVAQHAVLATNEYLYSGNLRNIAREILHHDDPECITGDIPKQVKIWLGESYYEKERLLHEAFNKYWDLKSDEQTLKWVKYYDEKILSGELKHLTYIQESRNDLPQYIGKEIIPWKPQKAYREYLKLHYELEVHRKKSS